MYLLTRKNRVIDYCENGYLYVGNIAVCESKGTQYEDATIVSTEKEIPADIESFAYEYINGEFVRGLPFGESADHAKVLISTQIVSNVDLDDLIVTDSHYYCPLDATAKSLTNCPVTNAFSLEVMKWGEGNIIQRLTVYTTCTIYLRRYYSSSGWSSWRSIAFADEFLPLSGGTMTGTLTAPTVTVSNTLNIPGGKIWIA